MPSPAESAPLPLEDALRRTRKEEISKELESLNAQLSEAKADRRDSERDQQMKDCLETLKRLFPGVRGRVMDLCQPSQRKSVPPRRCPSLTHCVTGTISPSWSPWA